MVLEQFGPPPFGTLLSANANPSTLENWGEDSWVTLHQTGNMREHNNYWYLTEIFQSPHPQPALNGEPYYSGYADARGRTGATNSARPGARRKTISSCARPCTAVFFRAAWPGMFMAPKAIWGGDIEAEAPIKMWDAFQWSSARQMQHLRTFAFSIGKRYQELVPNADLVSPNKTPVLRSYEGWAYCARTPDKEIFLLYFEKGCPRSQVRGARPRKPLPRAMVRSPHRRLARRRQTGRCAQA